MINAIANIIGINNSKETGQSLTSTFERRVEADGGIFEANSCLADRIEFLKSLGLYSKASLILTPNGYKESKLYSLKPTDGSGDFSFSRLTTKVRRGSAYLEQVPYNLLTHSKTLITWSITNIDIQDSQTINPKGKPTTKKIIATDTLGQHRTFKSTDISPGVYTFSVYAKKAEYSYVSLAYTGGTAGKDIIFNLNDGTYSGSALGFTANIENVGNDWYRCSLTIQNNLTANTGFFVFIRNSDSLNDYSGDNISGLYIWGPQLVIGSEPKDYFETTDRLNIPSLDYNDTCPSILLEPQRTNLIIRSEELDSSWNLSNGTLSINQIESPNSLLNADMFDATLDGNNSVAQTITVVAETTYTLSWYVKRGTATTLNYRIYSSSIPGDIIPKTSYYDQTSDTEWERISLTFTTPVGVTSVTCFLTIDSTIGTVYLWGAQLEQGENATSYIPTTTTSVTRVTDTIVELINVDQLIGQTKGMVFIDHIFHISTSDQEINIYNTTADRIRLNLPTGSTSLSIAVITNNTTQYNFISEIIYNTRYKIAFCYEENNFRLFINGVKVDTDVFASVPAGMSAIKFNHPTTSRQLLGNLHYFALFKITPLDSEAIALTT